MPRVNIESVSVKRIRPFSSPQWERLDYTNHEKQFVKMYRKGGAQTHKRTNAHAEFLRYCHSNVLIYIALTVAKSSL